MVRKDSRVGSMVDDGGDRGVRSGVERDYESVVAAVASRTARVLFRSVLCVLSSRDSY